MCEKMSLQNENGRVYVYILSNPLSICDSNNEHWGGHDRSAVMCGTAKLKNIQVNPDQDGDNNDRGTINLM
jgi:hypothetical protein